MDAKELQELWVLLGKSANMSRDEWERMVELARLAVCEIREQRAAMQALKTALESCK